MKPGCLAALAALGLVACWPAGAEARPNVLFIAVDDLRPELGCYGGAHIKSPHIDRLAATGLRLDRAYCQQAVCSPSRTSLMTGLRPDSTKVYDLNTHFRKTVPDVVTVSQHFVAHGYHAVGIGKIYHGGLDDKRSWSVPWRGPERGQSYNLAQNQRIRSERRRQAQARGLRGKALSRASRGPATELADVPDRDYPDGALAEMAVRTLREARDQPFFLAVGFLKPHLPFNAPKKYWDLYDRQSVRLADNPFAPKEAPSYALANWAELRNYSDMPQSGAVSEAQARRLIHGYYACVSFVDAQVGRVLGALEDLGLSDNTIVILWGDHGWKLGEHGAWCKHTNFELDTRAPLIVRAPGMKAAGRGSGALVEFVDIYPTLCDLAGLAQPAHLEGTSFAPLLEEPDRPWKAAAFSQYPRGRVMGYSMRTDRFRYTQWQQRGGAVLARELYDHRTDRAENVNLATDPEQTARIQELGKQLQAGWRAAIPGARARR